MQKLEPNQNQIPLDSAVGPNSPPLVQRFVHPVQQELEQVSIGGRGRPTTLNKILRVLDAGTLARVAVAAVLRCVHQRPKMHRVVRLIGEQVGIELSRQGTRIELSPSRETLLAWHLVGVLLRSTQPGAAGAIRLERDFRIRRRLQGVERTDCYHLVADPDLVTWIWSQPDPSGVLTPDPSAVGVFSQAREFGPVPEMVERSIAVLENTAWRVNPHILRVVEAGLGAKPTPTHVSAPPEKIFGRCRIAALQASRLARYFLGRGIVHFTYSIDFRGQIRADQTGLSPEGSDLERALLIFRDGRSLGHAGVAALAAHGARMYGIGSVPAEAALTTWTKEHSDRIARSAAAPLVDRWWATAAKPWQFLAFACEWARFVESGRNPDFISRLPVQVIDPPILVLRLAGEAESTMAIGARAVEDAELLELTDTLLRQLRAVGNDEADLASRWLVRGAGLPPLVDDVLVRRAINAFAHGASRRGMATEIERVLKQRSDWEEIAPGLEATNTRTRTVSMVEACLHLARAAAKIDTTQKSRDRERLLAELQRQSATGNGIAERWARSGLVTTLTARAAGRDRKPNVRALLAHLRKAEGAGRANRSAYEEAEAVFETPLTSVENGSINLACDWLARRLAPILREAIPESAEAILHVREALRAKCQAGDACSWIVEPTGLGISQTYFTSSKAQTKVVVAGRERRPAYWTPTEKVDLTAHVRKAPGNLLCSLAAAWQSWTVAEAGEAGVATVAVTDGGVRCLASDVATLRSCIPPINALRTTTRAPQNSTTRPALNCARLAS